jgi:hypothetical protein
MRLLNQTRLLVSSLGVTALLTLPATASVITAPTTFATGPAVSSTGPDSVVYGNGSLWVSYANGADSTGASGSSTIVRYATDGTVLKTYSIAGNVDGLRIDPAGQVWAIQNNDGNSALTVINPTTNGTTVYNFGSTYTNSANRGFDDAVFSNGQIFLSETNPASGTDPVVLKLTSGLTSPLQVSGILNSTFTGTNLATGQPGSVTINDPDSLILDPAGDLVLTGEADQTIVFIHNPGASNQTVSFVGLLGTSGQTITGLPDDTVFPTATSGTFYIADTGANKVYSISATGLAPGSVFVDVGNEFGSLDTTTGIVTPIFTGTSPHGIAFVASPEPATFLPVAGALLAAAQFARRRKRNS